MTVAVVFDSAGTLLHTYRVAMDVRSSTVLEDVDTVFLTSCNEARALITLYLHSQDIMQAEADMLLSRFLVENRIGFSIAFSCSVITIDAVGSILYADDTAKVGDLQECIRRVWSSCRKESVVAMASGVMINQNFGGIEYTITSGGKPFPGAKSTITSLHRMGVATYVASGDRTDKLVRMADYLGIPQSNVHGVATPSIKAQVVDDLKALYDVVVMVGDGVNDLAAMLKADVAILSLQQKNEKPRPLYDAADFVIHQVAEVIDIVEKIKREKC
jgi:soluble P-type ATPase